MELWPGYAQGSSKETVLLGLSVLGRKDLVHL